MTLLLHHRKIYLNGVKTDIANISSLDECKAVLDRHKPDIVIHAAGLTSVEECEENPNLAQEANVDLANNIAIACDNQGVKLVHIYKDQLFFGNESFVTEESGTTPINNYAKTKLEGEQQVQKNFKDALIIRTNFFGWCTKYRQSFSDFIINKLRDAFEDIIPHEILNSREKVGFNISVNDLLDVHSFEIKSLIDQCEFLHSIFHIEKILKDMSKPNRFYKIVFRLISVSLFLQEYEDNQSVQ